MQTVRQDPAAAAFVQDPYPFYVEARRRGPLVFWADYGLTAIVAHDAVMEALRDRRLGRAPPPGAPGWPTQMPAFAALEALSLLGLEGADQARLRRQVARTFTSARMARLRDGIERHCHALIDRFSGPTPDLIAEYAAPLPVAVIADLLGVPAGMGPRLVAWSHAIVAMYRPSPGAPEMAAAERAASEFTAFLHDALDPTASGMLGEFARAARDGEIDRAEAIALAVLLLNAGHEASVHAIGNAAARLIASGAAADLTAPDRIAATVEEALRIDPPLHLFTRWVYAPVEIAGTPLRPGMQVACLLGAAARDPAAWAKPDRFDPRRFAGQAAPPIPAFGAGAHFCLGAALARLEMEVALRVLFDRCPRLSLAAEPRRADIYHFHGFEDLTVSV